MARLVDTQAAAQAARVAPATIRSWAQRGHLQRMGTDHHGRTLYALDDVYKHAATRPPRPQLVDDHTNVQH